MEQSTWMEDWVLSQNLRVWGLIELVVMVNRVLQSHKSVLAVSLDLSVRHALLANLSTTSGMVFVSLVPTNLKTLILTRSPKHLKSAAISALTILSLSMWTQIVLQALSLWSKESAGLKVPWQLWSCFSSYPPCSLSWSLTEATKFKSKRRTSTHKYTFITKSRMTSASLKRSRSETLTFIVMSTDSTWSGRTRSTTHGLLRMISQRVRLMNPLLRNWKLS